MKTGPALSFHIRYDSKKGKTVKFTIQKTPHIWVGTIPWSQTQDRRRFDQYKKNLLPNSNNNSA